MEDENKELSRSSLIRIEPSKRGPKAKIPWSHISVSEAERLAGRGFSVTVTGKVTPNGSGEEAVIEKNKK